MKTISKQLAALIAAAIISSALMPVTGEASDSKDRKGHNKVSMIVSGTLLINDVLQPIAGENFAASLLRQKAFGRPGRADIDVYVLVRGDPGTGVICPQDFPVGLGISDDAWVFTFKDLSQLYARVETTVCLDPQNGEQFVSGVGEWTGGTRRFWNVVGGPMKQEAYASPQSPIDPLPPGSPPDFRTLQFYSTNGFIRGTLERE